MAKRKRQTRLHPEAKELRLTRAKLALFNSANGLAFRLKELTTLLAVSEQLKKLVLQLPQKDKDDTEKIY